jgi:hypothetical protein
MPGLGRDPNAADVAVMLNNPRKLRGLLKTDPAGVGASPAAILADTITAARGDVARLARAHGLDMDAEPVREDEAAALLAGLVDGDGVELVEVFNDLAERRDEVLREALDDDEYAKFRRQKEAMMLIDDPETFDDEEGGE